MPALPWVARQDVDPNRSYVVMSSKLPLRRYRDLIAFFRHTQAIRRQLQGAAGLVGYSLDAQPLKRVFWTFSVWEDQASLDAFARAEPHRSIIAALRPLMGPTRFATTSVAGAEIPEGWSERKAPVQ